MRKDPRVGLHFYVWYRVEKPKTHTHGFFMGKLVSTKGRYYTFTERLRDMAGNEKKQIRRIKKSNVQEMQAIKRDKILSFLAECHLILNVIAGWKKDKEIRELEFTPSNWQDLASTMIIAAKEFI